MRSLASRLAMMFVASIKTYLAAENGTDRRLSPAQPRMVDLAADAVHNTTAGHPDPEWAATVPATEIAAGAIGQRGQRGGLGTTRRGRLDRVERARHVAVLAV